MVAHEDHTIQCARQVADAMAQVAHKYCVPIIAIQKGRSPAQCGTATLFQVADRHFLISAGHIVHDAQVGEAALFSTCAVGSPFIPLDQPPFRTVKDWSRVGDESGPFDIAVWPLSAEQVASFSEAKHFANASIVAYYPDLSRIPPRELFYLCGFPTGFAAYDPNDNHHLVIDPVRWAAAQCANRREWPASCAPKYHLVLNSRSAVSLDVDGAIAQPPAVPVGISGCAVWSLGWDQGHDAWDPANARIVGIETRVYREPGLIRATGWVGVRSILRKEFTELNSSFFLQFP